jgi:hypothetical protein
MALLARRLDHVEGRPSALRPGIATGRHVTYERTALSPFADACRRLLLLLSPLLSVAADLQASPAWIKHRFAGTPFAF